jgi:HAD superfamily hydrolase (TIGR01490 family)
MEKPIAVFDLDSTLLEGDCELMWVKYIAHKGLVDQDFLKTIAHYMDEYKNGSIDYVEYEKFAFSPLQQNKNVNLKEFLAEYLKEIERLFRPYMLKRVENHRRQGYTLLLASASNSFVVQPIAQLLNIPNIVCSWLEMKDGCPTGNLLGAASFREGKAKNVKTWVESHPVTLKESWGYSDSHTDLPILKLVQHPVAVTPDAKLRQYAQQQGWEIIEKPAVPADTLLD